MAFEAPPPRPAGRGRRYPSNAARQAAYRARLQVRQAAVSAAASGDIAVAERLVDELVAAQVARLEQERVRLTAERDRAEQQLAVIIPKLDRLVGQLRTVRAERDRLRQRMQAIVGELRQTTADNKARIGDLTRQAAALEHALAVQRRDRLYRLDGETEPVVAEDSSRQREPQQLNRAHRRAQQRKRRSR